MTAATSSRSVLVYCSSRSVSELPQTTAWLGPNEAAFLAGLRFPKRRRDWILGRWTAKRALLASHLVGRLTPVAEIEVLPAPDGAPAVFLRGERQPCAISLSHAGDAAFCALSKDAIALGCDIEEVQPREAYLVGDYFTREEAAAVESAPSADRVLLTNLIWSAKESALKAMREGLRRDTRSVSVEVARPHPEVGWSPLAVRCRLTADSFHGWWEAGGGFVRTVVAVPPFPPPVPLAD